MSNILVSQPINRFKLQKSYPYCQEQNEVFLKITKFFVTGIGIAAWGAMKKEKAVCM
jgi:hypothetical protein